MGNLSIYLTGPTLSSPFHMVQQKKFDLSMSWKDSQKSKKESGERMLFKRSQDMIGRIGGRTFSKMLALGQCRNCCNEKNASLISLNWPPPRALLAGAERNRLRSSRRVPQV